MVIHSRERARGVDAQQVAAGLGVDDGGHARSRDPQRPRLERGRVGVQFARDHAPHLRPDERRHAVPRVGRRVRRAQEDALAHPAVAVPLHQLPAVNRDRNFAGREEAGDGRRPQQHPLDEFPSAVPVPTGDRAEVPHHEPLALQFGGSDVQPAPLAVFDRQFADQVGREDRIDLLRQRRVVGERVGEQAADRAVDEDVPGADVGVEPLHVLVVLRPQKRQRGDQRPGADARYGVELGPGARFRPAHQQAGRERAVRPAAGQAQHVFRRPVFAIRVGTFGPLDQHLLQFAPDRDQTVDVQRPVRVGLGFRVDQVACVQPHLCRCRLAPELVVEGVATDRRGQGGGQECEKEEAVLRTGRRCRERRY
ncbi:hypothetical protein FTUN_7284 [Frigoriglobus tundricola]|uniref:Uncharacterized protein n=1 Tax=Frigoriglobus tundricola TaxID=2774151 RepID=A0A6M5Z0F0_9BACT|nr:hypothetical protein FTUN_7284 [Frigoriglobus tundricola]